MFFFLVLGLIAIVLMVTLVVGSLQRRSTPGKIMAIISGLLLVGLVAFTFFVYLLVWSLDHGAPM